MFTADAWLDEDEQIQNAPRNPEDPVDMEYFWLGRIPCRTVELVGVLVGIQVYEQRIVYACELRPLFVMWMAWRAGAAVIRAKTIDCGKLREIWRRYATTTSHKDFPTQKYVTSNNSTSPYPRFWNYIRYNRKPHKS